VSGLCTPITQVEHNESIKLDGVDVERKAESCVTQLVTSRDRHTRAQRRNGTPFPDSNCDEELMLCSSPELDTSYIYICPVSPYDPT
jgi:hypothetical protein